MKVLTLWEPWASFMAHGYKKNETRGWATNYRGPLAIHAAKNRKEIYDFKFLLVEAGIIKTFTDPVPDGFPTEDSEWPFGKIVCVVDLIDCISTTSMCDEVELSEMEAACGNYDDDRFIWVTKDLRRIEPPIPWKGAQGLWNIPDEMWEAQMKATESK